MDNSHQRHIVGATRRVASTSIVRCWLPIIGLLAIVCLPITANAQNTATDVLAECTALLPADRPIPTGTDAPSIRLTAPVAGETLTAGQIAFSVETINFNLNDEARHWHLWINGQVQGMVYQPTGIIRLAPGTYTICASLGNTDHADIGIPDGLRITVVAAQAGTPTPTLPVAPEAAPVVPEQPQPTQIILLIGAALVAAVGGWWAGSRLGKKRGK
jgi:hypothetical protein